MADVIGIARCPVCGSEKARLSLSVKSLPVITCSACSCQVFARADRSDELMRALHIAPAAVATTPEPVAPAAPVAPPPVEGGVPFSPKPKPRGSGTIFDQLLGGAS